ncbi:MAG: tRNA (N(6)-L-threonylcarbamoyladenosine(37)-C(2))-methylthiotransferase MtaB [Bacteroidales bacterium]|nr:tRNA (N(6)-L-threonylcarbamoyladenosine(37)-C(2))-methylthiotransferase MtaB [Bacteroidales bacterium]
MLKIYFHTLGCKLNYTETCALQQIAEKNEYEITNNAENANIIVVNTCTVTHTADKKSIYSIKRLKKINPSAKIFVTGCLATTDKERLQNLKEIDFIFTNSEKNYFNEIISNKSYSSIESSFFFSYSISSRTRAFVKVQDGCDYYCSYCKVPFARGNSKNVPINKVIETINYLYNNNFKEVILTGINLGDFGKSTGESFKELLQSIEKYSLIPRVRLSSVEPDLLTFELIEFILNSKKILPHFHIPLQSGNNEILTLMKRRYTVEDFCSKIKYINKINNKAAIGIDVIVGFPGESDKHFEDTYNLLKSLDFSYLHVFKYSERDNTIAAKLTNKVPPKIKKERSLLLHKLSAFKYKEFIKKNIGETQKVLVEHKKIKDSYTGYTENYIEVSLNSSIYKPNEIYEIVLTDNIINLRPKFSLYEL